MKLTKKLFIAIMTMALLVVTFTSSTFAWFTLSDTGKLENVKIKVVAGTGMEISSEGNLWKNHLDFTAKTENLKFSDVTTSDGKTFKKLDNTDAVAGENYLEETFYIRVNTENATVVLNAVIGKDKTTGESGNASKWIAEFDYTGSNGQPTFVKNQSYDFDPLNAVKVSFYTNEETTSTTPKFIYSYANGLNKGEADYSDGGFTKTYLNEKGYDYSLAPNALPSAYVTYTKLENATASNGFVRYDQVAANASKSVVVADTDLKDSTQFTISNVTNLDANYYYAKVTIRIWLEGWDPDCINAILDGDTELAFELNAFVPETSSGSTEQTGGEGSGN